MTLAFPFRYLVRTGSGPVRRGTGAVTATNGREARVLALEWVIRRCGYRPTLLQMEPPR